MSDVSMSHDRLVGMMSNRSDVSTNVQQRKSDRDLGTVSLSFVGKEVRAEPSLEKGNESCVFSSKNSCVASQVSSTVSSTVSKVSVRRREITASASKKDVQKPVREAKELKEEKKEKEKEKESRKEEVEERGEVEDAEEEDMKSSEKEEEDGEESYVSMPSIQAHNPNHQKKHSIQVKSLESIDVMRKQCPRVMYLECPTDQRDLLSRWNDLANKNKEVPYLHRFVKEKEDTVIIYEWEKRTPTVTYLDKLSD